LVWVNHSRCELQTPSELSPPSRIILSVCPYIHPLTVASKNDLSLAGLTGLARIYHRIVDTFEGVIFDDVDIPSSGNEPTAALLRVFDEELLAWKDFWLDVASQNPMFSWNTGIKYLYQSDFR